MLYGKCKSHFHYKFYIARHFIIQYDFYEVINKFSFSFGLTLEKLVQNFTVLYLVV